MIYGKKGASANKMTQYFDKLGAKYHKEAEAEKQQRKMLHPGLRPFLSPSL